MSSQNGMPATRVHDIVRRPELPYGQHCRSCGKLLESHDMGDKEPVLKKPNRWYHKHCLAIVEDSKHGGSSAGASNGRIVRGTKSLS